MPIYRVTMLFQFTGSPPCGFSERWDIQAADRATAKTRAQGLADARAKFLASNYFILVVRVGELSVVGEGSSAKLKQTIINLCPEIGSIIGQLGAAEIPNGAVYAKTLFTSGFKPRAQQFRGIPDTWWNAAATQFGTVRPFITAYGNFLKRNAWGRATIFEGAVALVPVDCLDLRRVSSRRTGRPFGLLRGRKSKKKIPPPTP